LRDSSLYYSYVTIILDVQVTHTIRIKKEEEEEEEEELFVTNPIFIIYALAQIGCNFYATSSCTRRIVIKNYRHYIY